MIRFGKGTAILICLSATLCIAQQGTGVTGDQATGYHMRVVSRSTIDGMEV